jgi:very-short-patch-repair endonuclease
MSRQVKPEHFRFARQLRSAPTDAERLLWSRLRAEQLGLRFRRQVPPGPYVADFVCMERRLIVELDGGQHNGSTNDAVRDAWLRSQGFNVLRFWNNEVMGNMQGVLEVIVRATASPPPQPSPVKGEGATSPCPLTGEGRDGGAA